MRVHINNIIVRRQNVVSKSDYKDYRQELREDFCCICGYCGKSEKITKNAFEIDHFMPKSVAPELEKEYSNLVYSCYTCNRKNLISGQQKINLNAMMDLLVLSILLVRIMIII